MSNGNSKLSPEDIAQHLRIRINGKEWTAQRVINSFKEKGGESTEFIDMVVTDGTNTQSYVINREDIRGSWMAFVKGGKFEYKDMDITMNTQRWYTTNLSVFHEKGKEWFKMNIINKSQNTTHSIAIERESLVLVYLAIYQKPEKIVTDIVKGIFSL
ncbi:MAG: hypothetical protein ACKUBY_05880 [Candidatus Moraniibacteriota bacterium]